MEPRETQEKETSHWVEKNDMSPGVEPGRNKRKRIWD